MGKGGEKGRVQGVTSGVETQYINYENRYYPPGNKNNDSLIPYQMREPESRNRRKHCNKI